MKKKLITFVLALTVASGLVACSDDDHEGHDGSSDIADSEDFNQADVDFATDMIQHHAQALSMVDFTVGRDVSRDLAELAGQIRDTQGPEIELMVDWLTEWDQPIPATMRDHSNAHAEGGMEMDGDMPGMMTAEELEALEAAQGEEFEELFLEMMIEHHEGAIEMATTETSDGEYPAAVDLAEAIIAAQQDEISQMEALLGS